MSATNRGAARRLRDAYPTPAWCLHRLIEHPMACLMDAVGRGDRLLEPCAGEGGIIRAWNTHLDTSPLVTWHAWEVRSECLEPLEELGAEPAIGFVQALAAGYRQKVEAELAEPFQVAITNPPFDLADQMPGLMQGVAERTFLLLQLNVLRPTRDRRWPVTERPNVYILPNRPCFTGDGKTDATEYAWFEFPGHGEWTVLGETPKEERSTRKPRPRSPSRTRHAVDFGTPYIDPGTRAPSDGVVLDRWSRWSRGR